MNQRHKRALRRTLVVFGLCLFPLWFFIKHQIQDVEPEIQGFGRIPKFTLTFANQPAGFTHFDTKDQLTVVAVVKDSCPQSCPETVKFLSELKSWADNELRLRGEPKVKMPMPIRFVIQTAGPIEPLPQDWAIVAMEDPADPYLVPEKKQDAAVPAVVLIDDGGYFRAYENLKPEANEILRRELSRMISQQYLFHYVTAQTLMWEKNSPHRRNKDGDGGENGPKANL